MYSLSFSSFTDCWLARCCFNSSIVEVSSSCWALSSVTLVLAAWSCCCVSCNERFVALHSFSFSSFTDCWLTSCSFNCWTVLVNSIFSELSSLTRWLTDCSLFSSSCNAAVLAALSLSLSVITCLCWLSSSLSFAELAFNSSIWLCSCVFLCSLPWSCDCKLVKRSWFSVKLASLADSSDARAVISFWDFSIWAVTAWSFVSIFCLLSCRASILLACCSASSLFLVSSCCSWILFSSNAALVCCNSAICFSNALTFSLLWALRLSISLCLDCISWWLLMSCLNTDWPDSAADCFISSVSGPKWTVNSPNSLPIDNASS